MRKGETEEDVVEGDQEGARFYSPYPKEAEGVGFESEARATKRAPTGWGSARESVASRTWVEGPMGFFYSLKALARCGCEDK